MRTFSAFLSKKDRENKDHLRVLEKILSKAGFQVDDHLDDSKESYLFINKPIDVSPLLEQLSFGGIRLYTRGHDIICYRSQNKKETEPFGAAMELDIKGMFKDLVSESNKDAVGRRIIFHVIKELKEFFIKSAQAEKEEDVGDSPMGAIQVSNTFGTDYSSTVGKDYTQGR